MFKFWKIAQCTHNLILFQITVSSALQNYFSIEKMKFYSYEVGLLHLNIDRSYSKWYCPLRILSRFCYKILENETHPNCYDFQNVLNFIQLYIFKFAKIILFKIISKTYLNSYTGQSNDRDSINFCFITMDNKLIINLLFTFVKSCYKFNHSSRFNSIVGKL